VNTRELISKGASEAPAPGAAHGGGTTNQYLSFFLGGEEYATDILNVQEIKGWDTVTASLTRRITTGRSTIRASMVRR